MIFVKIKVINPTPTTYFDERVVDLSDTPDEGHGGADVLLTTDFVKFIKGEKTSPSCTDIRSSVPGHKVIFLADKSMEQGGKTMEIQN